MHRKPKYHNIWNGQEYVKIPMTSLEELGIAWEEFTKEFYKVTKIEGIVLCINNMLNKIKRQS